MTAPCKDCTDRHYKCHSECEKYIEYNAERQRVHKIRSECVSEYSATIEKYARLAKYNRRHKSDDF